MIRLRRSVGISSWIAGRLRAWAWVAVLGLIAGCPPGPTPDDNTNGNTNTNDNTDDLEAEIITPSTSFGISSLDEPVSVIYTVPESSTDVSGYRVPVGDATPDSAPIGDPVIIATNLPAGERKAFSFDPGEAGVGFYRVGVLFTVDGEEEAVESAGVIHVEGSPNPVFIQPPSDVITEVVRGTVVTISFDVGDPENDAQWRLFILSPFDSRLNPPDQLGEQLAVGLGNAGLFSLDTSELELLDYQLGLSATDSGASVADTVARGEEDRIVTVPDLLPTSLPTPIVRIVDDAEPIPPTIEITAPGATEVVLDVGESFTIVFAGEVFEEGASAGIDVFHDTDTNVDNGYTLIASDLPVTTTSVALPTDLPPGTYRIGATIRDGINVTQTDYAAGSIRIVP